MLALALALGPAAAPGECSVEELQLCGLDLWAAKPRATDNGK